ncbi:hypothetical protein F5Y19DRAFT_492580 [Xylariaceae sp. FL1651]|nr:hypothetical protein F5Y19DRAFT_492580 [Xylariaceae sp. FL1651]
MSLEIVADTLRLELAPFGVNVIEVVTGAVKSNGQTKDLSAITIRSLTSRSLYKSIKDTIADRAQGNDGMEKMDTSEYTTAGVDDIMNAVVSKIWHSVLAKQVRMSTTATSIPQSALDPGAVIRTSLDAVENAEK